MYHNLVCNNQDCLEVFLDLDEISEVLKCVSAVIGISCLRFSEDSPTGASKVENLSGMWVVSFDKVLIQNGTYHRLYHILHVNISYIFFFY